MGVEIKSVSETRNSGIRSITKNLVLLLTKGLHRAVPELHPNHINLGGAVIVTIGSVIAAIRNPLKSERGKTALTLALTAVGSLGDAVDGSMARVWEAENPTSVDSKKGQIYDALSDRTQESSLALSRLLMARNKIGEVTALGTAITSSWPSIARATAEKFGKVVPETGKGVIGLVGTRIGRAFLGIIATTFPHPKGLPVQEAVDFIMTGSNALTAADRFRAIFAGKDSTLSQDVKENANNRLIALGTFAGIAFVGSLLLYRLKEASKAKLVTQSEIDYKNTLITVEEYCQYLGLDHRFVGGTLTDFIGPQTKFEIDVANKTVKLINPNSSTILRSDGTNKDIDLITFTPDRNILKAIKPDFANWPIGGQEKPSKISSEAARYPDQSKPSILKQWVSSWIIDKRGAPHLTFGKINQALKPESIEPWKIDLGDGVKITTFNPVAHALCYALRVPSGVKKKDRESIGTYDFGDGEKPYSKMDLLTNFANQVVKEGTKAGIDYKDLFTEWFDYIETLSKKPDVLTKIKAKIIGIYWDKMGTDVAHGKGPLGFFSRLSDKLNG